MPEIIDPVFAKASPKRSFSVIENERFGLVFAKTGSINAGTGVDSARMGIDSCAPQKFYKYVLRAGIFKKSMGARHRGGIGFSYRPARLHRLAEFIPWNQFWGPINI